MTPIEIITVVEATAALVISLFALKQTRRTADAAVRQTALNEHAAHEAAERKRSSDRDAQIEFARKLYEIAYRLETLQRTLSAGSNIQGWRQIISRDEWGTFEAATTAVGRLPFAVELKGELDAAADVFGPFDVGPSNRSHVVVALTALTKRLRTELHIAETEDPFPSEREVVTRFVRD